MCSMHACQCNDTYDDGGDGRKVVDRRCTVEMEGKGDVGWAAKAPGKFLVVYYNRIPLPPSLPLHVGMHLSAIPLDRRIYVASKQAL